MARRKNLVGDLEIEGKKFTCSRWQVWPPKEAFLFDGRSSAEIRGEATIDQYNRLNGWEITCGLMKMEEGKCPSCPYVLVDGKPMAPIIPNRATRSSETKKMQLKRRKNF